MCKWKIQFLDFCLEKKVLKFGKFQLKSGKCSPYYFNSGLFNTGNDLQKLGYFYAKTIIESNLDYKAIFGVAYKGIPIVISTAIALRKYFNINIPYCFNRKELKKHGEKGNFIGQKLTGKIILLDDVMTSGFSINDTINFIHSHANTKISGIIIALDRTRNINNKKNIQKNIEKKYNLKIFSIISILDIINYFKKKKHLHIYLKYII
ncbi:orotate phosphoribosyltransferase [Buchnera aphidicola str. Bp (Baizongia pistaciae)]|uniref:Orotate phosphoribosyltransferase n=1 Tax=Buchnera aphidicola subsp. Baizongia pistaciae (strain Bp) TaxID=224915 RepID=PYRE_BUCBP|nr:orotate phosphoribosyltransferase [Buchnera aphidicola]P59575.1 RecName: Full=Orotate phosphoribosyltransferase; Short=OPRT; Short=OPRTase [Buchnera aphidicola str. Bp (Baizongia pistaciae)]AAO27209.1 orotate phosphoribosyltransferase [Buchnera aphidicola str. Bp (Baizongia pistaciae)]